MTLAPDALRRILHADPVWSAYAIADLQPALQPLCRWFVGRCAGDGGAGEGLVLLYAGLEPPVLFATGPAAAVADALTQAQAAGALPSSVYLSVRHEHEAVLEHWYDVAGSTDRRPMLRMVLRDGGHAPAQNAAGVVRLHTDDAPRLERLFAQGGEFAPDAFAADQVASGVFYGAEAEHPPHDLLAAGGTHIVDWDAGVAAIGNFYTRSADRGRGLAGLLLSAIVRELRARHVNIIVLNVDQRNANAQRLYQRHGFAVHCAFLEGEVQRQTSPPRAR